LVSFPTGLSPLADLPFFSNYLGHQARPGCRGGSRHLHDALRVFPPQDQGALPLPAIRYVCRGILLFFVHGQRGNWGGLVFAVFILSGLRRFGVSDVSRRLRATRPTVPVFGYVICESARSHHLCGNDLLPLRLRTLCRVVFLVHVPCISRKSRRKRRLLLPVELFRDISQEYNSSGHIYPRHPPPLPRELIEELRAAFPRGDSGQCASLQLWSIIPPSFVRLLLQDPISFLFWACGTDSLSPPHGKERQRISRNQI